MNRRFKLQQALLWVLVIIVGFGVDCALFKDKDDETILAEIGDYDLTVKEFQMSISM